MTNPPSSEPLAIPLAKALVDGRQSMDRALAIILPRFLIPLSVRESINKQTEDIVRTTRLNLLSEIAEQFQAIAKDTGDEGFKRAGDVVLIQIRGEMLLMQQQIELLRAQQSTHEEVT